MATRSRLTWKPSVRGYYERSIGWKLSEAGVLQQHKFLLGTDLKEAQKRERKLRELWEEFARTQSGERPLWPPGLLEVAKRVAKGASEVPIPRKPDEQQTSYADRIRRLQKSYPVICFVPADQHAYEVGRDALQLLESLPGLPDSAVVALRATDEAVRRTWLDANAQLDSMGLGWGPDHLKMTAGPPAKEADRSLAPAASPPPRVGDVVGSLHTALRAYQQWIEKEFHRAEHGAITAWGRSQVRQIDTLIEHHRNRSLGSLDAEGTEELIAYWRRRPLRKKSTKSISAKSASNYISQLGRFFDWLQKSSRFDWRKPEG